MLIIECPKCKSVFEIEACFDDGHVDDCVTECVKCDSEILYDIEFDPVAGNEKIMPACKLEHYGEIETYKKDFERHAEEYCSHCDRLVRHIWREDI